MRVGLGLSSGMSFCGGGRPACRAGESEGSNWDRVVKSVGEKRSGLLPHCRLVFGEFGVTNSGFGSFFLAGPKAFPDAVEGTPWGDQERFLDLPGGPFLVSGLSASQAELMDREYASVIATAPSSQQDRHETAVLRSEPGFFREIDIEGWDYTLDLDSTPDQLRLAALQFAALVRWNDGATAALWTSVEDMWFQGVIENYLRVVVAHRLLLCDGLLLHSAGAVVDGSAYLFVGASGAGKSTLAGKALDAGAPVLSDDLNAVVDLSVKPAVAQLPFTGELRDQDTFAGTVPLRGIFVLKKGDTVACETLSRGEAVAAIVATAPFINRGGDNLEILVETATQLTAHVPVGRLTTAKASSFEEIKRVVHRFQQ